jgi:hypothetical protein
MEHNRKQKLLMIIALVSGIASLSVGFAAFSVSLNISSSASVTPNSDTFSVKFSTEKDRLTGVSVQADKASPGMATRAARINNSANPTIEGLYVEFSNPGQYAEYIFYARNEGEYTAYLNSVEFLGNKACVGDEETSDLLVQNACESINITIAIENVTYTEMTPVTGHSLPKGKGEQITIRLEYSEEGTSVDGNFSVTFQDIALVYSTTDNADGMQPTLPTIVARLVSGNINTPGSIVAIENEKFYVIGQENGNVKLLSMYNLHVGNRVERGYKVTPLENTTGIQDKNMKGYNWSIEEDDTIYPVLGTVGFSNTSSLYSGSIVEEHVNNYVSYLGELGANIQESRLIYLEELEGLGCLYNGEEYVCGEAPSWVYQSSYWTGTTDGDYDLMTVITDSRIGYTSIFCDSEYGIRPVIEISISEIGEPSPM